VATLANGFESRLFKKKDTAAILDKAYRRRCCQGNASNWFTVWEPASKANPSASAAGSLMVQQSIGKGH
jgi:hypothetical protein